MAKFCPLFSGSSGNSCFIGADSSGVLVDAGVSAKRILGAMEKRGLGTENIKAVFITHQHSDHISGLPVLIKKLGVPIIASAMTLQAIIEHCNLPENAKLIEIGSAPQEIAGFEVSRFPTSHDCEGSSGYTFTLPYGQKISVCTDLGIVTDEVRRAITGSNLIMLESNHDLKMLKDGPYPPLLKTRIMSDKGHLSNRECATELPALLNSGTQNFILGHLSMHNNLPALAVSAATGALLGLGAKRDEDYRLTVAKPEENGVIAL